MLGIMFRLPCILKISIYIMLWPIHLLRILILKYLSFLAQNHQQLNPSRSAVWIFHKLTSAAPF